MHSMDGMSPIPKRQCVGSGPTREGAIHEMRHLIAQRARSQYFRIAQGMNIVNPNKFLRAQIDSGITCYIAKTFF